MIRDQPPRVARGIDPTATGGGLLHVRAETLSTLTPSPPSRQRGYSLTAVPPSLLRQSSSTQHNCPSQDSSAFDHLAAVPHGGTFHMEVHRPQIGVNPKRGEGCSRRADQRGCRRDRAPTRSTAALSSSGFASAASTASGSAAIKRSPSAIHR